MYRGEFCSNCNQPRYLCHNDDPDLVWDVMEDSCAAKAAVEQREEDDRRSGGENWKPEKGTRLHPKPVLLSGGDPVSLRDSYYEREAERFAALAADEAESLSAT